MAAKGDTAQRGSFAYPWTAWLRRRLDNLLTERGLMPSRTAAASAIRAGEVRIGRGGEGA